MACDICGKTGTTLEDLLDQYQTDDIKQICPECANDVNAHLRKLRKVTNQMNRIWLKRFMRNKKGVLNNKQ